MTHKNRKRTCRSFKEFKKMYHLDSKKEQVKSAINPKQQGIEFARKSLTKNIGYDLL